MIGMGTDLVDVKSFAVQLNAPGTRFGEVFTPAEHRAASRKSQQSGSVEQHLAARWAAKESFVKAWSAALYGLPNPIEVEDVQWQYIEVVLDRWGRPSLYIHDALAKIVELSVHDALRPILPSSSAQANTFWHVSMSHDGDYATATVVAELRS
ncbi:holo-ACP synthase AcpS [Corynebacterium urogenitale]